MEPKAKASLNPEKVEPKQGPSNIESNVMMKTIIFEKNQLVQPATIT